MKACTSPDKKHAWAWRENIEVLRISIRGCSVTRKVGLKGLYRCASCKQSKEGRALNGALNATPLPVARPKASKEMS